MVWVAKNLKDHLIPMAEMPLTVPGCSKPGLGYFQRAATASLRNVCQGLTTLQIEGESFVQ